MKTLRAAIGVSAAFLLVPAVQAQEPPLRPAPSSLAEAYAVLSEKKVSADFTDAPLQAVLEFMRDQSGLNIIIDPAIAAQHKEVSIMLRLDSVDLKSMLSIILRFLGLKAVFRHGAVVITTPETAREPMEHRAIDVVRLLMPPEDADNSPRDFFNACRGRPREATVEDYVFEGSARLEPDDLLVFVRDSIDPETWELPGASIEILDRMLVVTNFPEVLDKVESLVSQLDREGNSDIKVKVRVLPLSARSLAAFETKNPGPLDTETLNKLGNGLEAEVRMSNCRRASAFAGSEGFLRTGAESGTPRIAAVDSGILGDFRVLWPDGGHAVIVSRFFASGPVSAGPGTPKMPFLQMNTCINARIGEWTLAGFGPASILGDSETSTAAVFVRVDPFDAQSGPGSAVPSENPADEAIRSAITLRRLTVDYADTSLKAFLRDLADRSGVSVVLSPRVFEEFDEEDLLLTLSLTDATVEQVLSLALETWGIGYCIRDGAIQVLSGAEARAASAIRARISVCDLVANLPDFMPANRGFESFVPAVDEVMLEDVAFEPVTGDRLLMLIRERIDPESWDIEPHSISYRNKGILAFNSRAAVDGASKLISGLREKILRPVRVSGCLLDSLPAGFVTDESRSMTMDASGAEKVRSLIASGEITAGAAFSCRAIAARRFFVNSGRQVLRPLPGGTPTDHACEALIDGLSACMKAIPSADGKTLSVAVNARFTNLVEPADPFAGPWTASTFSFIASAALEQGGAAIIAGAGAGGPRKFLFVVVE